MSSGAFQLWPDLLPLPQCDETQHWQPQLWPSLAAIAKILLRLSRRLFLQRTLAASLRGQVGLGRALKSAS